MSYSVSISKNNAQANFVKISLRARPLHAVYFSRVDYAHISELAELHQPGVYLLISDNMLYVGEADDLLQRIDNHIKTESKRWWTHAICFHTMLNSPDPLNKAMVKYLEHIVIAKLKSAHVVLDNQSLPNEPFLSEVDKSLMDEEFVPSLFEVLDVFNIYKPNTQIRGEKLRNSHISSIVVTNSPPSEEKVTNKVVLDQPRETQPPQVYPEVEKWFKGKGLKDKQSNISKTEKIKNKHYCEIKLDGRTLAAKNWSEMYLEVFKYLISIHGEDLVSKAMPNRVSSTLFMKDNAPLMAHSWTDQDNKKWYVLTEIGTDEKRSSIRKIAQLCHCDLIMK